MIDRLLVFGKTDLSKQRRPWSDAALSGSTLFVILLVQQFLEASIGSKISLFKFLGQEYKELWSPNI